LQVRRNRDEEAALMANVPGWEVGTYYGEKVYKTLPEDSWKEIPLREYFAHVSLADWKKRVDFTLWT